VNGQPICILQTDKIRKITNGGDALHTVLNRGRTLRIRDIQPV